MKPRIYYQDDRAQLWHGDTLDVLELLVCDGVTIDAAVFDPPYASGARTEAKKSSSGAMVRGERWNSKPIENDQMTTTGFIWLMRQTCYLLRDMLPEGGSLLSFIDWRQWPNLVGAVESTNLRVNGMVVWDKGSYGLGNGFRSQHELVLHASKGTAQVYGRDVGNVLTCKRADNADHPSPKPVRLMADLIRVVVPPGGLVMDCFAGGGATLVAARDGGYRAIGIEIEELHCETIARRLSQSVMDLAEVAA